VGQDVAVSERSICVVYTQAKPGRESEYHDWYDSRHLHDVLRVAGVVSAQRYDLDETEAAGGAPPAGCLAIYEVEGDPRAFVEELRSRFGTNEMLASPALDRASISMTLWKPHGERITA
jgi:hypothetical protein